MTKNKMIEVAGEVLQTSINDLQYREEGKTIDQKYDYARGQIGLMYELEMINEQEKFYYMNELKEMYLINK